MRWPGGWSASSIPRGAWRCYAASYGAIPGVSITRTSSSATWWPGAAVGASAGAGAPGDRQFVYLQMTLPNLPEAVITQVADDVQFSSDVVNIWGRDYGDSRVSGGDRSAGRPDRAGSGHAVYDTRTDLSPPPGPRDSRRGPGRFGGRTMGGRFAQPIVVRLSPGRRCRSTTTSASGRCAGAWA